MECLFSLISSACSSSCFWNTPPNCGVQKTSEIDWTRNWKGQIKITHAASALIPANYPMIFNLLALHSSSSGQSLSGSLRSLSFLDHPLPIWIGSHLQQFGAFWISKLLCLFTFCSSETGCHSHVDQDGLELRDVSYSAFRVLELKMCAIMPTSSSI